MESEKFSTLLILYSEDTEKWQKYICDKLDETRYKLRIQTICDTDIFSSPFKPLKHKELFAHASCTLVIVSPGLLNTLQEDSMYNLSRLVEKPEWSMVLLCGIDEEDLCQPGSQDFRLRFPQYTDWKIVHTNDHPKIFTTVISILDDAEKPHRNKPPIVAPRPQRRKNVVKELIPAEVKCEEITDVVVVFKSEVAECHITVVLSPCDAVEDEVEDLQVIEAVWVNTYMCRFLAPEHIEGNVKVKVMQTTSEGPGVCLGESKMKYTSQTKQLAGLVQAHVELAECLLLQLKQSEHCTKELDTLLRKRWAKVVKELPDNSLEQMFGMYYYAKHDSHSKCPTLLHLATRYHLPELCTMLLEVPDSAQACAIKDSSGMTPQDLAKEADLQELADVLDSHQNLNEEVAGIYTMMMQPYFEQYYNTKTKMKAIPNYLPMNNPSAIQAEAPIDDYEVMEKTSALPPRVVRRQELRRSESLPNAPFPLEHQDGLRKQQSFTEKQPSSFEDLPRQGPVQPVGKPNKHPSQPQIDDHMPTSQRDLIGIMNMVKNNELTIDQAQRMFTQWKEQYQGGATNSIKEKKTQLDNMRKEIQGAQKAIPAEGEHKKGGFLTRLGMVLHPGRQPPIPPPRPEDTAATSGPQTKVFRRPPGRDVASVSEDPEYLALVDHSNRSSASSTASSRDSGLSTGSVENTTRRHNSLRLSTLENDLNDMPLPPLPPRLPPKRDKTTKKRPKSPPPQ